MKRSGKYKPLVAWSEGEYIHLDVDGIDPKFVISGVLLTNSTTQHYFLCKDLHEHPSLDDVYAGKIDEIEGIDKKLKGKELEVKILPNKQISIHFKLKKNPITRTYMQFSEYFDTFELEIDYIATHQPVISLAKEDQADLLELPVDLQNRDFEVKDIFERAGFEVSMKAIQSINLRSRDDNPSGLFDDDDWKLSELNDAMTRFWSSGNQLNPEWAIWTFLAGTYHSNREGQKGIMLNIDGGFQRQGVILFYGADHFKPNQIDPTDPIDALFIERSKLFYLCHEIGHTFNLDHPHPTEFSNPWLIQ